jgi:hypothetical protein
MNPMDSSPYVYTSLFTSRRCDRIQIPGWGGNDFWLLMKRCGADHFISRR